MSRAAAAIVVAGQIKDPKALERMLGTAKAAQVG